MDVGIVEIKSDSFMKDVVSRLSGLKVNYISLSSLVLPVNNDMKVVVDRIGSDFTYTREFLKSLSMNGTYVINNPFTSSLTNKIIDLTICKLLGIPVPKTVALPQFPEDWDSEEIIKEPDIEEVIRHIELPCILKPYNGYAWENVYEVKSVSELRNLYSSLRERHVMIVQEMIERKEYYRAFCIGKKEVLITKYVPKANALGVYLPPDRSSLEAVKDRIEKWTISLNRVLDLDFNAIEWSVDGEGRLYLIDAYNDVPEITHALPQEFYEWVVEKFSAFIREAVTGNMKNRNFTQS